MPSLTTITAFLSASAMLAAAGPIQARQAGSWGISFYENETGCQAGASYIQNYTGGIGCTPFTDTCPYGNGYGTLGSILLENEAGGGALTPRLYSDSSCSTEWPGVTAVNGVDNCYNIHGSTNLGPCWIEVDQAGS